MMHKTVNPNCPQRIARAHVLAGSPIPSTVQAQLEARGIDVGDLHNRLVAQQEFAL